MGPTKSSTFCRRPKGCHVKNRAHPRLSRWVSFVIAHLHFSMKPRHQPCQRLPRCVAKTMTAEANMFCPGALLVVAYLPYFVVWSPSICKFFQRPVLRMHGKIRFFCKLPYMWLVWKSYGKMVATHGIPFLPWDPFKLVGGWTWIWRCFWACRGTGLHLGP